MSLDKDCLFCKIIRGEIPSKKVYEDEKMLAFYDIAPQAKIHVLCVPKTHFSTLLEMNESQAELLKDCMAKLPEIARLAGSENGYRVIINQGKDAGQTVFHLHIHILGGQDMGEKML